ncbi:MAG: hypothetical protein DRO12_06695 [Thermoprotei archaeon]|nr:MAG: hypothetical protein DRO12_06695 [Thermoprotei archaeon]
MRKHRSSKAPARSIGIVDKEYILEEHLHALFNLDLAEAPGKFLPKHFPHSTTFYPSLEELRTVREDCCKVEMGRS